MACTWASSTCAPGGSLCTSPHVGGIKSGLRKGGDFRSFESADLSTAHHVTGGWDTWQHANGPTWRRLDQASRPCALTIVCAKNKPRKRGPGTGGFYTPNRRPLAPRPRPPKKVKPPELERDSDAPPAALDLTKFKWTARNEGGGEEEKDALLTPQDILNRMDEFGIDSVDDDTFVRVMGGNDSGGDPFWENYNKAAAPKYDGEWSLRRARELKKRERVVRRKGGVTTKVPGPGEAPSRGGVRKPRETVDGALVRVAESDGPGGGEEDSGSESEWGVGDETFAAIQREFGADLDEMQGYDTDSDGGDSESGGTETVEEEGERAEAEWDEIQNPDDVDLSGYAEGVLKSQEHRERQKLEAEEKKRAQTPPDMRRILAMPEAAPPDPAAWEFADENGYLTQDSDEHEDIEYDSQVGFSVEWFHNKLGYNDVFKSAFPEEQQSLAREVLAQHLKGFRKMEPGLADFVATRCSGFLDHEMLTKPPKGSPAEGEPDLVKRMELRLRALTKFDFLWAYFEALGLDQERTKLGVMFQPVTMTVPLAHRAITYLREGLGFKDKEIHAVIVDSPHLLRWQPDAYRKRREFFAFVGWDEKKLIQQDPAAYSKDVENQLKPMYELLERRGVKDVKRSWKEAPIIFGKNTLQSMETKLELLLAEGFTPDDVNSFVVTEPDSLALNIEKTLPPLVKILKKWGFTERQRVDVLAGWPEVFEQRRIFFNDRLKFLIEENGRTPAEIATWPQVMWYDVVGRLEPCFNLAMRYGYLDKDLEYILQPPEEVFSSQRHLHPWLGDPKEIVDDVVKNGLMV
ncbi:hypothetical protein KFL_000870120 [Klebsormidium nitens]|uniref:Rhodanese domain-containing protein n=1 Tax=Klebsormidium nitens TaxID=105231 RepID=A0A1Y1HYR2_KLENI|nr:hypothetical protein KFL_000870120 [Klebsormidium nitens]|eukprot:GAQ81677.1 hypothetical protein KFL_000870120 [Klebsormidium nitens]